MKLSQPFDEVAALWETRRSALTIRAVDSHTEGNPTRVLLGDLGLPEWPSVTEARDYLRQYRDQLRRLLVHEPRGGNLMCAVYPFPSRRDDADVAAVIMEQDEYVPMCGHCMIGLATTLVELDLVPEVAREGDCVPIAIETPAGVVRARVHLDGDRVSHVQLENVASYVAAEKLSLMVADGTTIAVDVLYGGDHYITVDAADVGLELVPAETDSIISIANDVRRSFQRTHVISNPATKEPEWVYQVLFRSVLSDDPLVIRNTVVAPPGAIDRSPCGTGTSALTAWAVHTGRTAIGQDLTSQGITGTTFTARALEATQLADQPAIMPRVQGSAYLTGFSTWVLDTHDPFPEGFRLQV
jgi:proline racemase